MLSKQYLINPIFPINRVELPDIGDHAFVRTLSGTERDAFESSLLAGKNKTLDNFRAKLLVRCLCDEGGERIFGDEDMAALGNTRADVLDQLFTAARRLNGIGNDDVKELTKNS